MQGTRLRLLVFALALAGLFLLVNCSAYHGFFSGDDLDNMGNARLMTWRDIGRVLAETSLVHSSAFRAAGYSYYVLLTRWVDMNYWPYVAVIHAIHLLNVLLLWMLARALGADIPGAAAAAILYVFHAAAFDIYWKPMYIFDLLCGTLVLAALLSYVRGWLIPSVIFFWVGLKSKESIIFLPLVIAAYEFFLGGRRWKRVLPFLAVSFLFGVPALFANRHRDNAYTFRFTPVAVWQSATFYARWLLLVPYAGFLVLAIPFIFKNRRVWFGVCTFLALLGPMLFLPGRLFAAYLYVPLLGLAIAVSAINRLAWAAAFLLVWIPLNIFQFRQERREELIAAQDRRTWVISVEQTFRARPDVDTIVYDGAPTDLGSLGMAGLLANYHPHRAAEAIWLGSPESSAALDRPHCALVGWDPKTRRAAAVAHGPDVSYIRLTLDAPMWQLRRGWPGYTGTESRWMAASASARLYRPAGARFFEVIIPVSQYYLSHMKTGRLEVRMKGVPLGSVALEKDEVLTVRFPVPPGSEGSVEVEFDVQPPLKNPNGPGYLGQPIAAFGFPDRAK